MEQTPVHDVHNPDLLQIIPPNARKLIEIGCSSGALAREFKKVSPTCDYLGVEIDAQYAELARRYCDECLHLNVEHADDAFWAAQTERDCWIFGDTLEHMVDPWKLIQRVRRVIPADGAVLACIPNMQHWTIQVRLSIGDIRYEPSGLLDRTHLRWFTRQTILELFAHNGFKVEALYLRMDDAPTRDKFLPAIEHMAKLVGMDPAVAVQDAMALQYVVKAVPV